MSAICLEKDITALISSPLFPFVEEDLAERAEFTK
jgi:hypothetical protein